MILIPSPDWQKPAVFPPRLTDQPYIFYGIPSATTGFADFLPPAESIEYGKKNGDHGSVSLGARVTLRQILGQWSGIPPARVVICSGPGGKPQLVHSGVNFSVAHTGSAYLLSFATQTCGVDMDIAPPASIDYNLIGYVCNSNEAQYCREGDPADRFLQIWTGKEAVMKLSGICNERRFREIDILQGYDAGAHTDFTVFMFKCPGNEWGALAMKGACAKIIPAFIHL
jgi:phosphopantetheinyl transferase